MTNNKILSLDEQIAKDFPPSIVNNSRVYIHRMIDRFKKHPSESLAQKIEYITGFPCDFSDDWGNGARGSN